MPAVVGDVFGLGDVYIRTVSPVTVGIDPSGNFITESGWSNLRSHGWFGGGGIPSIPATTSSVDRIDFSNDTIIASLKGSLGVSRRVLTSTGNSNYGWFGGGWFSPSAPQINYSTVDRIDFSNDSSTASVRGSLSATRYALTATGNSNYGWFGGGKLFDPVTPSNTAKSTVDRIDFSNDSATASPRGPLSSARQNLSAVGNSNYGWFGGGVTPTPSVFSTVDRIDFSNDSATASVRGPLSAPRSSFAATGNSNYGWFGGPTSSVDRIDFSNDSATASVRGPLSALRIELGATSGQAKSSSIRLQKTGNYGWFGGGTNYPAGASVISNMTRISFFNDSVTALVRGQLTSSRYNFATTGNSNYGWFSCGVSGFPNTYVSINNRMDFSNDNSVMANRTFMPVRSAYAAVSNTNYGWFGNGSIPGPAVVSTVNRIDFNNDLLSSSPRGPLSLARRYLAATGNSNYGWFGGGNPGPLSTVDRIDFSNDSATSSSRGLLSVAKSYLAATGNSNYGWFGGGYNPTLPFNGRSTVDRVSFSNDLVTALPRGILNNGTPSTYAYMAATSNTPIG